MRMMVRVTEPKTKITTLVTGGKSDASILHNSEKCVINQLPQN